MMTAIEEVKLFLSQNFPGLPSNLIYEYLPNPTRVIVSTRKGKKLYEASKGRLKIFNLKDNSKYIDVVDINAKDTSNSISPGESETIPNNPRRDGGGEENEL